MKAEVKSTNEAFFTTNPEDWTDSDHLMVLAGWARDGYTFEDIANAIGIGLSSLIKWRKQYPEIEAALKQARQVIDYKVENALLKAALGYTKKEVVVTTIMRYGRVVETQKEESTLDVPPSTQAIQFWLTNRLPDKWKRDPQKVSLDEVLDDGGVKIEVVRAQQPNVEPEDGRFVEDKQITLSKLETEDLDYWPDDWEDDDEDDEAW